MSIPLSFFLNDAIEAEIEAFCAKDPELAQFRQKFHEAAEEIGRQVSYDLYDKFETSFNDYLGRTADLYYLFALNLRQEFLRILT